MKLLTLFALLGLALGMSCSSSLSKTSDQGTDGEGGSATGGNPASEGGGPATGGTGGAGGCAEPHYYSAGCSVTPRCPNGFGGSCAGYACSCSGHVISGCATEFAEPYAYTIQMSLGDGGTTRLGIDAGPISVDGGYRWDGVACDPNATP